MNRRTLTKSLFAAGFAGTASAAVPDASSNQRAQLRAKWLDIVVDDFIIDLWHNGKIVPIEKRELRREIFGATVERITLDISQGDWLVFNAVNNRLRWGGCRFFGLIGFVAENEATLHSRIRDSAWSYCDRFDQAMEFIEKRDFLHQQQPHAIEVPWGDGTSIMNELAGGNWRGEPIWGRSRNTFLKLQVD